MTTLSRVWKTAAAVSATLLAVPVLGAGAAAQPSPDDSSTSGFASATADIVRLNPAIGNTPLTIWIGESLAGHQGVGAYGEARWLDLGFIGDTLAGEGCDGGDPLIPADSLPQPVLATATGPDVSDSATGGIDSVIAAQVHADSTPQATTTIDVLPLELSGLIEVRGSKSTATSTGDGHRARAVSEISSVDLAGGLVRIEGMRWEAERQVFPDDVTTTDFTIGRLVIGGVPVPLPLDATLDPVLSLVTPILQPLGIQLTLPEAIEIPDGVELTPLSVGIVPAETRDGLLSPLLGAAQEPYNSVAELLIDIDCGNATYVTILDIILGTLSGAGYTTVDLGGARVTAGLIETTSLLQPIPTGSGAPPPMPATVSPSSTAPAASGTTGSAGSAAVPPSTGGTAPAPASADTTLAVSPIEVLGSRGGPLVAVGFVGLIGAGIAAELDRRRMRAAQRSMPT